MLVSQNVQRRVVATSMAQQSYSVVRQSTNRSSRILRAWHHRIARRSMRPRREHFLVDVEIAGVLAAVAVQDDVCGIGEDLRRAAAVGIDAGIIANAAV